MGSKKILVRGGLDTNISCDTGRNPRVNNWTLDPALKLSMRGRVSTSNKYISQLSTTDSRFEQFRHLKLWLFTECSYASSVSTPSDTSCRREQQ